MQVHNSQVWSLSDMLKQVDPENVVKAISMLSSEAKRLMLGYDEGLRTGALGLRWEPGAAASCFTLSEIILGSAQTLNMVGVERSVVRLRDWLIQAIKQDGELSMADIKIMADGLGAVVVGYGDELDGRKIFAMTPQFAHYYPQGTPLFGAAIADAFPASVDDIDEGGKCLAMGLPTACVFHLMRAAEAAAAVVVLSFDGKVVKDDGEPVTFGGLFKQVSDKVDAMPKGPDKDAWNKLKGFMSSLNRGDRTKVAHPGRSYSEAQAERLISQTKAFLEEAEELLRA